MPRIPVQRIKALHNFSLQQPQRIIYNGFGKERLAMRNYSHTTPSSKMPSARLPSSVLHSSMNAPPPKIVASHGNYLFTKDGDEIFDATGGAAVAAIGHNDRRVHDAVERQMRKVSYCYAPLFTTQANEDISQFLVDSTGGEISKVFVVSSGTEAIEAALKMARQYFLELPEPQPSRTRFIARDRSYHGNTLGALSVGGHKARRAPYQAMLSNNVSHVSSCYPYRDQKDGESDQRYVARLAKELEDEFVRLGPNTVCAFVAETVSGSSLGCTPPVPGYFKAMKDVCDRHGALFILDEVMSGMGRTGTLHAWEQEDVVPDLQTVAKGLGAGFLPIGALMVGKNVADVLGNGTQSFAHSQTYQGHPVACAAAFEVQNIIKKENMLENVRENGEYFGQILQQRLGGHKNVGNIRGRGYFWGIEFVKDKDTKEPFEAKDKIASALHHMGAKEHGISLLPSTGNVDGMRGDMILLAPAFNVTREELELITERTARVVEAVLGV